MAISLRITPPQASLHLHGEVDLSVVADLRASVLRAVAAACRDVDLDLTDVSFMDCSGVDALLWCRAYVAEAGGRLTLTRISPQVARILALTGLDSRLQAAAASLVPGRHAQPMYGAVRPSR